MVSDVVVLDMIQDEFTNQNKFTLLILGYKSGLHHLQIYGNRLG